MNKTVSIPKELAGQRLDQVLATLFPQYSRSRWAKQLKAGKVKVSGIPKPRCSELVLAGTLLEVAPMDPQILGDEAEARILDIVYEDEAVLVLNKPAGLTVHPGAGQPSGTLLNALLHHSPALKQLPRAGIVHRLDKDTTGLLVVAKQEAAYQQLVRDLAKRRIKRLYEAVVQGTFAAPHGSIDLPIGRDPHHRTRMAVVQSGKPAKTHYRVLAVYAALSHLELALETGRTHQIRVHLAHIGRPIVGDLVYGKRSDNIERQALHAKALGFYHPTTQEWLAFSAPLPPDLDILLKSLA